MLAFRAPVTFLVLKLHMIDRKLGMLSFYSSKLQVLEIGLFAKRK